MDADLEATAIWRVFDGKADKLARVRVESLIESASGILDRIVETFPTYTLHNRIHAINVVRRMGDLLGDAAQELTPLEAALLLLSAFFHDIGMYTGRIDLTQVAREEWFDTFLNEHPDAYIRFHENGEIVDEGLAESYCRWRHADRVYTFLNDLPVRDLSWGIVPLSDKLGELCRSHNQDAAFLKNDELFETNFIQEADLRFCAIMLRLGDILDFDRYRSPDFVYAQLGLASGTSERARESNREWQKHRAAQGFIFPGESRTAPYSLPFVAAPDEPAVEHDVREFLNVIDGELLACSALMQSCSDRWRSLPLPREIHPDIHASGYRYGEYRFALDRHAVLQLFMGETLYGQSAVFVRELLQNASDTTRHRVAFEASRGNVEFEPRPVNVTEWTDADGYRWVRVDDVGMDMDENLILDYFLSVGRSYYSSNQFRADMLRYASAMSEFTPVSRFGIGVLSCFMLGDRVEVATRRADIGGQAGKPIRLSLRGLESFYVLQVEPMRLDPMPSRRGPEERRSETGTAIAVRVDPRKEGADFDLRAALDRLVSASPVPIAYQGEQLSVASEAIVSAPWLGEVSTYGVQPLPRRGADPAELTPGEACAIPLDLTSASPDPRFRGQMALLTYPIAEEAGWPDSSVSGGRWTLQEGYASDRPDVSLRLEHLLGAELAPLLHSALTWSHSGIVLPDSVRLRLYNGGVVQEGPFPATGFLLIEYFQGSAVSKRHSVFMQFVGCWAFADDIRLDLSVSRDLVLSVPWALASLIQLSIMRACEASGHPVARSMIELGAVPVGAWYQVPSLGDLLDDPLMLAPDGWLVWPVVAVEREPDESDRRQVSRAFERPVTYETVSEIQRSMPCGEATMELALPHFSSLASPAPALACGEIVAAALARAALDVAWTEGEDGKWRYRVVGDRPLPISTAEHLWPPLFMLSYVGSDSLRSANGPLNRDHPFSLWLLEAAVRMRDEYPATLTRLIRNVSDPYAGLVDVIPGRVAVVNASLDDLRRRGFAPSPPVGATLTAGDFSE